MRVSPFVTDEAAAVQLRASAERTFAAISKELRAELPGDELARDPVTYAVQRSVTVRAPAEAVWPWIAQIGFGRAGWYSYDLLDNLGRHSKETIIPSLQQIQVGDVVPMGPGGAGLRAQVMCAPAARAAGPVTPPA